MGVPIVGSLMKKTFGTRNERMVKRYLRVVDRVNEHEPEIRVLSDQELRAQTEVFRDRIRNGEKAVDMIPEVFAVAREAMDRTVGIRNIFNPAHEFDPSDLPEDARRLYDEVKAEIDRTEDAPPTGVLQGCIEAVSAWQFVDIPAELYQAVRDLHPQSKPPFRARPFDVQIIGAVVLYEGQIAEMKTGEGKTIVAPLSTYLAILEDMQVHVVTVNDYLVQRDRDWVFPFFRSLGLTVGAIHPHHMQPPQIKMLAYGCDVVYGTTSEFGFDYLRDNMKMSVQEQVQKRREFAIVDEVDSTLIDEARTPLIISGMAHDHTPRYDLADDLARHLVEKQREWNAADEKVQSCMVDISGLEGDIRNARDKSKVPELKSRLDAAKSRLPELETTRDQNTQYYELELDKKRATCTHEGIEEAQGKAGIGSFYVGENMDVPHLLEQALRAHAVYQRDRDYVVAPDEEGELGVVIVDQNTGRKMVGRQWSDGLHQAVESKEGVKIKQETQTMATITIQNFFKQYKRLAGMTGTADTEATEFHEIYGLDVICIPTNVPIAREDRNDLVFLSEKDKWDEIVDEIKRQHDIGRPVLVGTTSVEKSEMLSEMLTRRHNVPHEVLNAKQHEREADIIANAGQLGAVSIATNMAGRGTDIRLGEFTQAELIDHWKRRGICPRQVTPEMDEAEVVNAVFRQVAPKLLGMRKGEVEGLSDDEVRLAVLRHWAVEHCWMAEKKAAGTGEAELLEALDGSGVSMMHRLRLYRDIEDMGGLHVVATERHDARRIDNQLRGRSGRQGDKGSSRFFLSLEDDLMKMFAGETTLKLLSKLGMKEGDAIEHPMLTKSVERAQRKVEERNFLWRKNILEYDEIMDLQRGSFYGLRQEVLEGRNIKELIFEYIEESVHVASERFLSKDFVPNCITEWVLEKFGVSLEPDRIRKKDREDLHKVIRIDVKEDTASMIIVTLGEFTPSDVDSSDWDYRGLVDWAYSRFQLKLKISDVRDLTVTEITELLENAAEKIIDATELSPLDQFLVPNYGEQELGQWANNKFGTEFKAEDFSSLEESEEAVDLIMKGAREAYRRREITYPVDFAMDMTAANLQEDPAKALTQFAAWARMKYGLDWTAETLQGGKPAELREKLIAEAETWDESRIARRAGEAIANGGTPEAIAEWFRENYGVPLTDVDRGRIGEDPRSGAERKIADLLRGELTQFERWILLQILDSAWKDHLHSMDQVKDSIGYRAFSQKDPRIEYKQEGARLFQQMEATVKEKVTDLVFKARLAPQRPAGPPNGSQDRPSSPPTPTRRRRTMPAALTAAQPATAAASAAMASAAQRHEQDQAAAESAGGGKAVRQPRRVAPTVGRNEPCPCGSGKKYKHCHGKR